MRSKRKLLLSCTALLFLVPTCIPEATPVNQICGGYDDTHIYCSQSATPQAVHAEVQRLWPNQAHFIYVSFGRDTGREGDVAAVEQFFTKIQSIIDYARQLSDLRFQERSFKRIESAKKELNDQISARVNTLGIARTDATQALETGLKALITADKAPLVEQLDSERKFYPALTKGVKAADTALRALIPEFTAIVQDFKTFKAGETGLRTTLTSLSNQASSATVDQLSGIESQLLSLERAQYTTYSQLQMRIISTVSKLNAIQIAYSNHMTSPALSSGATERGIIPRDLVGTGARTLGNMAAYAQARDVRMSVVVADLIRGCSMRRESLLLAQADAATRQSVANAAFLAESAQFLDQTNQRIAKLLGAWPKSPKLQLPLYSAQYDEFSDFLEQEALCQQVSSTNSAWMQTGCNAYAVNFDRARLFLSSLPNSIRLYAVTLQSNGAPAALITRLQGELAAGKVREAVSTYDAAVRAVDGG